MVYLRCDFSSKALEMATSLIALLPDETPPSEAPVIYLLHGLSDNCTGWTRFTAVERYARERNVAVIMPEVQRSFYADMALGIRYFSYIRDELPAFCQRMFGLSSAREKNYVMGLSMGGYGALKCALTAPERYGGCAAFSAVTDIAARRAAAPIEQKREFDAIYGPGADIPADCDLFRLIEKAETKTLPRFYITCGEDDGLYQGNVHLTTRLKERGCQAKFEHWPGGHEWRLWDRSVERAMEELLPKA